MDQAAYNAWLASPAAYRCILLEAKVKVGGNEITRYMSTRGYVSRPSDFPANTLYAPVIAGGISFRASMGVLGSPELSFGDLEIHNDDGALDAWAGDIWTNRDVIVLLGDSRWPRSDFKIIYTGVVELLDTRVRTRWNLRLRDKLQRLNVPVTETKVGGTTTNSDMTMPVLFGECHNITPVLVDPALLEYQVHDGTIESVYEVRDNGIPIVVTNDPVNGKFRLTKVAFGAVTCSAQGDKFAGAYIFDAGGIVRRLATGYGRVDDRFTASDIDDAQIEIFRGLNPQPIGRQIRQGETVLEAIVAVAASVGARPIMSRDGRLQLLKMQIPPAGTPMVVTPSDMVPGSLKIIARPMVQASVRLGYAKNWTVQTGITTGLPAEHKEMFAQEWFTTTSSDANVAMDHNLSVEPKEQEDTMLIRKIDSQNESDRRLSIKRIQRTVYEFEGYADLLFTELGSPMTIQHPRFGLSQGRTGQVVAIAPDWMRSKITIGVII